ncbi:MAG: hypothetical protein Q9M25_03745, partial [Mariprofundaceae bacterium]|nr:hypothetical protein [Mariprofundaceae bacterium]
MRIVILTAILWLVSFPAWAAPTVIELHQTACQFIEPEGEDQHYRAASFGACEALNARTGEQRLAASTTIKLAPGPYVFRVHNVDVPYALGFWLRGSGLRRVTLPGVSGGGIKTGSFRDYVIELKAGTYRYSCPLNPTPDYVLQVEAAAK